MEPTFDFGDIVELNNPEPESLKKVIATLSGWQKDFDSLAEHIAEGLARCEIICDENNVPFNYKILSTNKAFEKHTGLTKELCINKTILEIMPDAERSWIEVYGRVALTQIPETITGYNKHTKRHYKSTAYSDKHGEFMMLFEDITFQKELEKAYELVSKSTKFSSDIINNMIEGYKRGIVICDENNHPIDFKIAKINDTYAKIFGLSKEEIEGKTMLEVFPEAGKDKIETFCQVGLTGKPISFIDVCEVTGKVFDISIFSPKHGEFILFIKDITEREASRIELEKAHDLVSKSNKLNADLLLNMIDGFKHGEVILDDDNNPIDFKIILVNKAYEKETGLKATDLVGKTMLEVFPDIEKSWITTLCDVAMTGESKSFVEYNHNTDKYFETSAYCPKKGEFALFVKDVTEKEKARIRLEQAYKKVEESEHLKSAFLANMSHEIRSPLNAILGFTDLMEEQHLTEADKEKCLTNIKNSGNRLLALISDILDISKLEANQQQLKNETHNLNEIIDRLFDQFSIIDNRNSFKIKTVKSLKNDDAHISTDTYRLQQIFSNLIENALKHTEQGQVSFGYELKGDFLEFFVSDTGDGITTENQKLIFERFRQIENKTNINQGAGLGIPIAAGFSQLFGGEMWLDSEVGKGSTFYFTIPYLPVKAKNKRPVILVAEDEEANFMLLEMWMGKFCDIVHAHDGNEAVTLAHENKDIDLILMDIKMPYLNGIEATKQIRQFDLKIPIIALTAFVMDDEKEQILKAGCNQLLPKPIKRDHFKKLLTSYVPDINLE